MRFYGTSIFDSLRQYYVNDSKHHFIDSYLIQIESKIFFWCGIQPLWTTEQEIKQQKLGRKAKFKALLLDKNFEQENPKKLEELTNETCRWPIGHPYEEKFYFCGRKPMEKFPYCKLHVLYAFQPKNAKEEDQITEEDIPKFIEKKIKSA